jgi:DNA-binding PadR family transcriptional regulator
MTKLEVLEMFTHTTGFLTPDRVWMGLQRRLDRRSVYSYLLRLKRQGLLESGPNSRRGFLAYKINERGLARVHYFRSQPR